MSRIAVNSLYKYVKPELPGCPEPMIDREIIQVLREFCKETNALQCDLDPINVADGQSDYDLSGWYGQYEMIVPLKVELEGVEQRPGVDYEMPKRCTIRLLPTPNRDILGGLEIKISLRPKFTCTEICECLWDEWFQSWAYGVMARLMVMQKKKWTNPVAARYEALYWDAVGDSRITVEREFMMKKTTATARWKFA